MPAALACLMASPRKGAAICCNGSLASVSAFGRGLQCLQYVVEREAADFLTLGELPERAQKLSDVLLSWYQKEDMFYPPTRVIHAFVVGRFEWVGAQIEEFRQA
jgi:hypothetical protein